MRVLSEEEWRDRARRHHARVATVLRPHCERKSRHQTHPVYDFLFSYYSFRTSNLEKWNPGFGIVLEGNAASEILNGPHVSSNRDGLFLDARLFPEGRRESLRHVDLFLKATANRPANFGCSGLHEWAMVYRAEGVRYENVPLRMNTEDLAKFVESQNVICSHYDAFRFFTEKAKPLNRLQPVRESQIALDQPGCLHVNMDLYKWSYKFFPWVPSELVWDCFLLAAQAREIDMRASPYDLRALGFAPIPIETVAGRQEYEVEQRKIAAQAEPLRKKMSQVYEGLVLAVESAAYAEEKISV